MNIVAHATFRLALALVGLASHVVPAWHRAAWNGQWQGDLWALRRAQERRGDTGWRGQVDLMSRSVGVFRHAAWLRAREWRVEMLLQDVRHSFRTLLRRPAFTAMAVLTLAIGVGANATIAAWIDGLLFRPLPGVPDVDRLVAVVGTEGPRRELSMSYPDFADMKAALPPGVTGIICTGYSPVTLRAGREPDRAWASLVSGNYFEVLGVGTALGRAFRPEEDRTPETHAVVVVSHRLWQRGFGGDSAVIGRTVLINERAFTVIGVAAEGFRGSDVALASDLFIPMMMQAAVRPGALLTQRGNHSFKVQARLAPGTSVARAQAGFGTIAARLATAYPESNEMRGVAVYPLWRSPQEVSGLMGPVLAVLMAMVGVVLLVACTNVAGLLLARGVTRQREVAVRLAVGASRPQLVRFLLAESLLLAVAGGGAGLAVACWTSRLLQRFMPPLPLPILIDSGVNPRIFLFALAVSALTGVAFGLVPALHASRPDLVPALKDGAQASRGPRRALVRKGLVVAQVALSLLLLVMAALFWRTLGYARSADPGFSMRTGILASIDLLPGYDPARGRALYGDILDRLRRLPGVQGATFAKIVPLGFSGGDLSLDVEGYTPAKGEQVMSYYNVVSPGYFETMGIPLRSGRPIDDRDTAEAAGAVVVNETLARRYWKDGNALGRRLRWGDSWAVVVGVAKDGKYERLTEAQRPFLYIPLYQAFRPGVVLHVRTQGDPVPLIASVRRAIHDADPTLPVFEVRTMAEHLQIATFMMRMAAILLAVFGIVALLLATMGLYGVLAQMVAQRAREVGIRMALGASRADVLRLVMRQGLGATLAGLGLGLVLAVGATRLVASQLFGVGPLDPIAFIGTSTLLVAATVATSYLPARRAAVQDPVKALRQE